MSERRIVRAAAAQLSPVLPTQPAAAAAGSCAATIERVVAAIDSAAREGVQLIVFPETVVPYYPYFSFITPPVLMGKPHLELYEQAVTVPSAVTDAVASAARRHGMVVVLGVNERDHGSLYNAQLIFDADGTLLLKRRKITPTYHERMVWGQGDGAGLRVMESAVGRIGALACWEHYNPLARYSLMAQHEEIHCSQFPGSLVGPIFAEQMEVTMRHHALESGCFVINATAWLDDQQIASLSSDAAMRKAMEGGCYTAIISPEGKHLCEPLRSGEGLAIADLDMSLITKRKRMMDSVGHYARPELLSLLIDQRPTSPMQASVATSEAPLPSHAVTDTTGSIPHEPADQTSDDAAADNRHSIARFAPR